MAQRVFRPRVVRFDTRKPRYFVRQWQDVTIYGVIVTSQFPDDVQQIEGAHARGLLFSECFSVVTPDGELGFTPAASVQWITRAQFDAARAKGWQ